MDGREMNLQIHFETKIWITGEILKIELKLTIHSFKRISIPIK